MAKKNEPYFDVIVESYEATDTSGLHGQVHIRPVPGQGVSTDLRVACSKSLSRNYPVGTRFKIRAKLTDREGEGEYLSSHHLWPYTVME